MPHPLRHSHHMPPHPQSIDPLKQNNYDTDKITINLEKQEIKCCEKKFHFEIDNAKKYKIINQIDTIGEIFKKIKLIEEFEKSHEI